MLHVASSPHFVCPWVYPFYIIWQLRVDAEFSSLPTAFPKTCDAKHSPATRVILAQKRSSWVTCTWIIASPLISSTEHIVCDVVVHVHASADVAGYYRHLEIKHRLFIMEVMKYFTEVAIKSPVHWAADITQGLPLSPPVVFSSIPLWHL